MPTQNLAAVILAAGKGTRMKSQQPKVLHQIAGQPLALFPVQWCQSLGCCKTVMVVGHQADRVKETFAPYPVNFVVQEQQLGTGHALMVTESALQSFNGTLLLLCGDVPLLREETLKQLIDAHRTSEAAVTVLTTHMENPYGYGRIIRNSGQIEKIVEEKDATSEQKNITEINTGIYAFEAPLVYELLHRIGNDNAQGEYYLTDIISLAQSSGLKAAACVLQDPRECMGINDRVQLAEAGEILRQRINHQHMVNGVTLQNPATTYIDNTVTIEADTVIEANCHVRGASHIGAFCHVETGSVIDDCQIGSSTRIKAGSVVEQSQIGEQCAIGPMAHLRPGTVLHGHNKLGNFVETKKAVLGPRSQASHLTYIGDAELGSDINLGCGTITCNYDGVNKHKTVIEDGVFVGSDCQLIAPVTLGRNCLIGAGSTITKDVPEDSLALSRSEQKVIKGWRKRKK
ncbi:bifunctional UDP-N-acetylglucosamine diphosphorylase/glucosamine-1-phosphate N-acetyltransferase GlmU [Desulfuromonas acetoxidans]|uniref:Bifunctional protein GlmU n=1 Tax=Desulfuromonas acetoxidans (strain DSM 684 / 11070) TaxID=281689 RepID=Q1JZE2_DESA6|nr:bifunctional UDP-N-acetylglucosamine diphosphorylase/glucosamine-1-phosphate N-acetyltransferase GlmU [Desulfuromonas acetoxidans]EAT15625.1 UDP-N-acetylglucosamine pyrophosphorylase [Desulfuromonas acetoxidans DSM 684]MBF0645748.1 bifunctional UDP-N-acetylglucosamine diphosphorylase/glucosamine-1-phosphate N-acetyltransferase GlmU [Desulfuromonas acetoxidans]NVD25218.1 bifunctional UDP-N-acetylglucosamine diphosphorylase/glucosamine-1-phosphate N-acetyltransferase GlmU [Desulfuromonas acetox